MPTPTPPRRRKPRADAERNRARVLNAARDLFTARGEDVQMPEVARAAGVGVGTVYRHFPSRAALIEAAGEQRHADIVEFGRTACLPCPDAADGLTRYIAYIGEVLATDRGLTASIEATLGSARPAGAAAERTEAIAAELIARARAQGVIRPDVEVADLSMIVCGLAAIIRNGTGDWRRYVQITMAGLHNAQPDVPFGGRSAARLDSRPDNTA
ncbi:TetR/AcrR family transcriptional regulator [Streptomyces zagrosensis]|uniref:AcrR family transcriptional regulator n=1 Tax=Streptomyces zagrosensis TaxID=1042984 RepID=A0A7W9Q3Z9_9ACTN|nr:helix-turn-helix domain-containing protein [Streptomyces zagrosensis]MBB5933206.1 AcrR family transcriptional regulator [Streptomyces zagrosensis]